jgi:hypothetical protein
MIRLIQWRNLGAGNRMATSVNTTGNTTGWRAEARAGLAFEAGHLAAHGPLLARYRRVRTGG